MKIALCFFGFFGKENIKNKIKDLCDYKLEDYNEMWSIEYLKKNIICDKNVDIFFHCWNQESEIQELLLKEYKPKNYKFEKQDKNYDKKLHIFKRHYSEFNSVKLMKNYALKNNIEYDFVFLSVFDQIFLTKINFNELNNNYIYTSNWNTDNIKNNYYYDESYGLYDQWYISNMNNMIILTDYFNIINCHKKLYYKKYGTHIQRLQLIKDFDLLKNLRFITYIKFDHIKTSQVFLPQHRHILLSLLKI